MISTSPRQFNRQRGFAGRRPSGHKYTDAAIGRRIAFLRDSNDPWAAKEVSRLLAMLPSSEISKRRARNQRQLRKDARRAWAAGSRRAFEF